MYTRRLGWSLIVLSVIALTAVSLQAQTNAGWAEWETFRPEGEEFTVLMPKNPSSETSKLPYHKMELTTRLYLSSLPNGPLVAVASFNGIKSNPAMYTDFQRFNSYVDAFKNWFPEKARGKDAPVKLSLTGDKTLFGYAGREYNLTIGNLTGIVQAYITRKRFYAIVSLNTKKDAALQDKFVSSFVLPDKPAEQQVATVEESPIPRPPKRPIPDLKKLEADETNPANQTPSGEEVTPAQPNSTAANPTPKRAPINGGMLNGKAIYLPLPEIPPGDSSGIVMVQVMIDESGAVIEARAISGPPQFHTAAVNAARLARFTPTTLMGEPIKVTGTIRYNFTRSF